MALLAVSESISIIPAIDSLQLHHLSALYCKLYPLSLSLSESQTLCYSNTSVFSFSLSISDVTRAIELLEKLQESGDVPGHKLQSLKKVLQSEFCTAIREVRPTLSIAVPSRV